MKHDVSYYRTIQKMNGVHSKKEAGVRSFQHGVYRDFNKALNWEEALVNGQEQQLQIVDSSEMGYKNVKARPGEVLRLGDLVNWKGQYWLVTKLDATELINYAGSMQQCNTLLRWQTDAFTVKTAFGVAESISRYGTGIANATLLDTADFTVTVKLQYNDDTKRLRRERRFLLGAYGADERPLSFKTTRVNPVTNTYEYESDSEQHASGIVELTLAEDELQESDNLELGLANYIAPPEVAEEQPEQDAEKPEQNEGEWF